MALIGKHALFGTAVLAALGVPYVLSDMKLADSSSAGKPNVGAAAEPLEKAAGSFPALKNDAVPVEGPAVVDLGEVLRFDLTPSWVMGRWPRVMNARHEAGSLHAYRVPLVTGHKEGDLAGSLTYYFDEQQKVQRIQFQGNTGDTRPLVEFLAKQHGFARRTLGDPSQFVYDVRRDGKAVSELTIRNAPVIDASQPQSRFRVELVLERPAEHRMFSDATQHRFDSRRWP
jgi:hypothetical protein